MKENNRSKGSRVLIISIVTLLLVILFTSTQDRFFLSDAVGLLTTPMQKASGAATDTVREFLDIDGMSKDELQLYVKDLEAETIKLRAELTDYYNLVAENERLKQMLDVNEERPEILYLDAAVNGRDPNDVFYGFTVDRGYLSGVSEGCPVMTNKGLVGVVTEVYATSSYVTTILSERVSVSAFSIMHDERGVTSSDIISAGNGVLRLTYLKNDTEITVGTPITTSGAAGAYPAGLIIGYVQEVRPSEYDISKYAIVKPYEDVKTVKNVLIIIDFPGKNEPVPDLEGDGTSLDDEDAEAGGE